MNPKLYDHPLIQEKWEPKVGDAYFSTVAIFEQINYLPKSWPVDIKKKAAKGIVIYFPVAISSLMCGGKAITLSMAPSRRAMLCYASTCTPTV